MQLRSRLAHRSLMARNQTAPRRPSSPQLRHIEIFPIV
jgi:hypothetical protein